MTMRALTPSQEQVLGYVADQGPVSVSDTAASMMMSSDSARSRLDTLERRGLLTILHTLHGRGRQYAATDKGAALAAEVFGGDDEGSDEPFPVKLVAYANGTFTRVVESSLRYATRNLTLVSLTADERAALSAARRAGGSATVGHVTVVPARNLGVVQEWWK